MAFMYTLGCGVTKASLAAFIRRAHESGVDIHALSYRKNGQVAAELALPPYAFDQRAQLYSLSKSFTSIAVGIAADEGLLRADEKIADIFPDKLPADAPEAAREARLCDLLSMQSGHAVCALESMLEGDPVAKFLQAPMPHKPGTTFVYSTGATCVCAAAVERRAGMPLTDYLEERLFRPLGIARPRWKTLGGVTLGGVGLYLSAADLVPFAEMLRCGGVYNGRRIVSEQWIKAATSRHSIDMNNGSHDWTAGYGYQFWLNDNGKGYRGDGAFGQLCIVIPDRGVTFILLAEATNMQREMDVIMDFIEHDDAPDGPDELPGALYTPAPTEQTAFSRVWTCEENAAGIRTLRLDCDGETLRITKTDARGEQTITAGNGRYAVSSYTMTKLYPCISQLEAYAPFEELKTAAFYTLGDGGVDITLRHLESPHTEYWHFSLGQDPEWRFSARTGTFTPALRQPIHGKAE